MIRTNEITSEIEFKKNIENFLEDESGTIGYRKRFFREQTGRLLAFLDGKIAPPYEIEVQPSSTCNAKCKHCYARKTIEKRLTNLLKKGRNMELIVEKILDAETDGFKVESIKFVGTSGDPLCNRKTLDVITKIKEAGRQVKLFTNGIGLSYRLNGVAYIERLIGLDYMRLSLDAGSAETWSRIKEVDKSFFFEILGSIEKLSELKSKNGSNLDLQIGYVITRQNYHEILDACKLVKNCGADSIRYRRDLINGAFSKEMPEIDSLLSEAETNSDKCFKVFIVHPEKEFEEETSCQDFVYPKCYVPFFWTTIGSDACLYPCGHRGGEFGWNLGNLLENNLLDLLNRLKDNPRACNLPDSDCVVCPPYAARLNPMLDYIVKNKNSDTKKILQEFARAT